MSCRKSFKSRIDQSGRAYAFVEIQEPSHLRPPVATSLPRTDASFFQIPAAVFLQKQMSSVSAEVFFTQRSIEKSRKAHEIMRNWRNEMAVSENSLPNKCDALSSLSLLKVLCAGGLHPSFRQPQIKSLASQVSVVGLGNRRLHQWPWQSALFGSRMKLPTSWSPLSHEIQDT